MPKSVTSTLPNSVTFLLLVTTEYSMYVYLDLSNPEDPLITSAFGPTGQGGHTKMPNYTGGNGKPAWVGSLRRLLGEAHGHPLVRRSGLVNDPGTSLNDWTASQNSGVPVYALRSWDRTPGRSTEIYRTTPSTQRSDRTPTPVGRTGSFNLAVDMYNITIKKTKK